MTTDTQTFTFVDPVTGEVSELEPEEREALTLLLAERLVAATVAAGQIADLKTRLALVMDRERPVVVDGYPVVLEAAPTPPRAVIESAVRQHEEALRPLNLAPVPQDPKPQPDKFPGVGAFTSKQAKADLARVALSPETFVHTPEDRPPVVKVYAPLPDGPAPPPVEPPVTG